MHEAYRRRSVVHVPSGRQALAYVDRRPHPRFSDCRQEQDEAAGARLRLGPPGLAGDPLPAIQRL